MENYLRAVSLSKEDFHKQKLHVSEMKNSTLTPVEDIRKIENILDLSVGILEGQNFYVSHSECDCGRTHTFYDFVFTALIERWHSPSFLVHTLVGRKYFVNESRPFRCSACGVVTFGTGGAQIGDYETPKYGCCVKGPFD